MGDLDGDRISRAHRIVNGFRKHCGNTVVSTDVVVKAFYLFN
jgi:hypothetical protein